MPSCTCQHASHQTRPASREHRSLVKPIFVSAVVLARGRGIHLEETLDAVSSLLSVLVADHEIIVVAAGLDPGATSTLTRISREKFRGTLRVYFLTQDADAHTACWMGAENALGDFVAVLDPASDDPGFLPELLDQAMSGVDIVFAHKRAGMPPRLTLHLAGALLQGLCQSLELVPLAEEAPHYRVLSKHVVNFLQHHPHPSQGYRRLAWTARFSRIDLEYSSSTRPRPAKRRAESFNHGMRRALSIVSRRWLPSRRPSATVHDFVARYETPYVLELAALRAGSFSVGPEFLRGGGDRYYPANPSIVRFGERMCVNVRLVNYEKTKRGFKIAADGVTRTRNVMFEWDVSTALADAPREVAGIPRCWPQTTRIRGLEDQRFIVHEGRLWFSACCSQIPFAEGRCCMVLGRMNERLDAVEHLVPLHYAGACEAEKNWLLWSVEGQLLVIYGYHPFTVLAVDPASGKSRLFRQHRAEFTARRFRGSAGPIAISERPGNWLMLVHEVAPAARGPIYTHRWIEVHPDSGIVAYSRPFVFDHVGIEYAAGLADNGDGSLTVTYGVEDSEARWIVVERGAVLSSLRAAWTATPTIPEASLPRYTSPCASG
jgi:hypothetical protein